MGGACRTYVRGENVLAGRIKVEKAVGETSMWRAR
jgi:hypothetical protein